MVENKLKVLHFALYCCTSICFAPSGEIYPTLVMVFWAVSLMHTINSLKIYSGYVKTSHRQILTSIAALLCRPLLSEACNAK